RLHELLPRRRGPERCGLAPDHVVHAASAASVPTRGLRHRPGSGRRASGSGDSPGAVRSNGPRVAIVGAGVSGISLAIALKAAGYSFTIFEKASSVGGTWRDNHYPGLTCDVPAFVYTFSASRNAAWDRLLAPGDE